MEKNYTEKLSKFLFIACIVAILYFVIKGIMPVLVYIISAAVVSLLGRPVSIWLEKHKIFGKPIAPWLNAVITLILVLGVLGCIFLLVSPVFTRIASDLSKSEIKMDSFSLTGPFASVNEFLIKTFPALGQNFKLQDFLYEQILSVFSFSQVSSIVTGVASFIASFAIGIFSVAFISFFFIKDRDLFSNMVAALSPDRIEDQVRESIKEIEVVISKYTSGLFLEIMGVTIVNTIGLSLIGRLGIHYSIGIAFMVGILNVIPYVGPFIGEVLGTLIAVTAKFICGGAIGLDVGFLTFAIIIFALLLCTQMIDNFFLEPFIYSTSMNIHPLEVFIVLIIVSYFGGVLGMFIAIPAYTVIRTIAATFFGNVKVVKRLVGEQ